MIYLTKFWNLVVEISPFLILGFFISGLLSIYLTVNTIKRYLGNDSLSSVFFASLLGVPLPLCSCGVIPVSAYLRKHGASKASTSSFLISTPQTGIDSIFITYSLLGPVFAIYRPIVALFSGLLGGTLTHFLDEKDAGVDDVECSDECCNEYDDKSVIKRIFHYGFVRLPLDIVMPLLLGLFVSSIIGVLIPQNYFELYGSGILGMIIMLFLGLPTYVCATASVPIAFVLYTKGFSMGAVLVFLMSGPATNITTISVCWKILGKKSTLIYLFTIIFTSISAGLFLDNMLPKIVINASDYQMNHFIGHNIHIICGLILLVIILNSLRIKFFKNNSHLESLNNDLTKILVNVDGMTCSHCEDSIKNTLLKLDDVKDVEANSKTGKVYIYGDNISYNKINAEIESLGFEVKDE